MTQEIRFCTVQDGTRLAYAKMGGGSPLVKVANWLSHLEYDLTSPVWKPWLEGWSRFHTLYRYDMRGCGLSDWDVVNFSLDSMVGDLETIVDEIGLEQFDLFAMSQGGAVAVTYTARHPERVNRLILYGSYLLGALQRNPSEEELEAAELELKLLRLNWGSENPAYRQVYTTYLIPDGTTEQFRWYNNLQLISTSPENAVEISRAFYSVDVRDMAAILKIPTLVIQANQDAAVPFEQGRQTAAQIPNARFITLESKNHVLLATEPAWPEFWKHFYRFLGVKDEELKRSQRGKGFRDQEAQFLDLTPRELEVLRAMVHGYQNNDIAQQLTLSPKTVRNYVSRIYGKLQVKNRREAVAMALRRGLKENPK